MEIKDITKIESTRQEVEDALADIKGKSMAALKAFEAFQRIYIEPLAEASRIVTEKIAEYKRREGGE